MTATDILLHIAAGDLAAAHREARDATAAGDQLSAAIDAYLNSRHGDVYDDPAAFTTFINNGGNVALYRETIKHIRAQHLATGTQTAIDIGCGDGRVTAATLNEDLLVDLVEPSMELLAAASRAMPNHRVHAHQCGIEEFLRDQPTERHWDSAQATFALHNLPPRRRAAVLTKLAGRVDRLFIAEFDVPRFADGSKEHAAYAALRYADGIEEYRQHPEVVRGFLMPVLLGQFDPAQQRHTYEQPIEAWVTELTNAGFADVGATFVSDYWWGQAYVLNATSP